MRLFKKKDKDKVKINDKLIEAMNYTPPDYTHTEKYIKEQLDPLGDARREIKKFSVESLVDENGVISDIRDSSIDSRYNAEKIYGRKQFIHNLGTILQIFDSVNESVPVAEAKKKLLSSDLEKINSEIKKYEDLQSSGYKSEQGGQKYVHKE